MNERDFCYWLQGLMELENPESLDAKKTQMIKDHLTLVFKKETPDYSKFIKDLDVRPLKFICDSDSTGTKYVGDGFYSGDGSYSGVDITIDKNNLPHITC